MERGVLYSVRFPVHAYTHCNTLDSNRRSETKRGIPLALQAADLVSNGYRVERAGFLSATEYVRSKHVCVSVRSERYAPLQDR